MQFPFSLQVVASTDRPLQALSGEGRALDQHPMQWKRAAILLGVGFVAVCLLTPAAAWAKGASSTPSYSFPAAVRGDIPLLVSPSQQVTLLPQDMLDSPSRTPRIQDGLTSENSSDSRLKIFIVGLGVETFACSRHCLTEMALQG